MPIACAIDPRRNLVSITLDAGFQAVDMVSFARTLLRDPALRPGMNGIIDTAGAPARGFDGAQVRALAELMRAADELWRGTRWAFVATSPVPYGMSRMFQMLRADADCEIQVFRDRAAAEEWLRISAPTAAP